MTRGLVGYLTDEHARSYGAELVAAAAKALDRGMRSTAVQLGDISVRIDTAEGPMSELIERALGPLSTASVDPRPSITVAVWDTETTGVELPTPPWPWQFWRHESPNTVLIHETDRVSFVDLEHGVGLAWFRSPAAVPPWERPAPLRRPIAQLLGARAMTVVHGGAVGDDERCVVLSGPGGRGKSSTVMTCVRSGMTTLGDDYLLVPDGRDVAMSLYATARLLPSSPAWDARIDRIEAPDRHVEHIGETERAAGDLAAAPPDKAAVFLHERYPAKIRRELPIAAICVPSIAGRAETTLTRIRSFEALVELAPSSLLQVDAAPSGLTRLARLVRSVPVFRLALGTHPDGVVGAIDEVLQGA